MCWEATDGEEERVDVRGERKESHLLSIYVLGRKAFMFIIHLTSQQLCQKWQVSHFTEETAESLGG